MLLCNGKLIEARNELPLICENFTTRGKLSLTLEERVFFKNTFVAEEAVINYNMNIFCAIFNWKNCIKISKSFKFISENKKLRVSSH